MAFVSITRLRVRSARHLPAFFVHAFRSRHQAGKAEGNLSATMVKDAGLIFWTRTVWRDEASMRAFLISGPHRYAMPHLLHWCDEASVVHWTQESEEPPSFTEAHRRMMEEGR